MPDIYRTAQQFKRELLNRERKAAMRMVRFYGLGYARISAALNKLTAQIEDARAAGEPVNPSWLYRQDRYFALLIQTTREIGTFADRANELVTAGQRRAVDQALDDSKKLVKATAAQEGISVTFNQVPKAAVENLAGNLADGSPLKRLFDELPRRARAIVENGLVEGIVLGRNPRAIATDIREGLGGNLRRALTISRTEVLRAYREATLDVYEENSDIVEGWYWVASLSGNTCAACIALHGTFHPLSESMDTHPNCRCTQVPGFEDHARPFQRGTTWFREQPAAVKQEILGTLAAYDAYRQGKVGLEDFVGRRRSEFGDSYFQLSVQRALAGERAFPE